jgi:hypothetical protein
MDTKTALRWIRRVGCCANLPRQSPSFRSVCEQALRLKNPGVALVSVVLLSLGLWALIWALIWAARY